MLTPAGSGAQSPEQHCDDDTQVSSAGLHRLPPTSQRMAPVASGAHTPEQHWLFEVQVSPSVAQPPLTVDWQVPPEQLLSQHWALVVHALPCTLHSVPVPQ